MTTFDDREAGFENKYAHDADFEFRVVARRNKLLGLWAADLLGMNPEEANAYAKSVIQADFEESGHEDVFRKVMGDLAKHDLTITDLDVRAAMEAKLVEARRQLMDIA